MAATDEAWKERLFSEYELKVKMGEVNPPNRTEYLLDIASEDSNDKLVIAARRLLSKRGIDWKTHKIP